MTEKSILALTPDQTPSTRVEVEGSGDVFLLALRADECEWFQPCVDRLRAVANLESNWDSYGAKPVDQVSVHYAHCFLSHFRHYVGIERPTITATPEGRVAFVWENRSRSMEVELDEKGMAVYSYESRGVDEESETADYLGLIQKLTLP